MKLFAPPNNLWGTIVQQAEHNAESLKDGEIMKQITSILRTNQRVAQSLGHPYAVQLWNIYAQMLQVPARCAPLPSRPQPCAAAPPRCYHSDELMTRRFRRTVLAPCAHACWSRVSLPHVDRVC